MSTFSPRRAYWVHERGEAFAEGPVELVPVAQPIEQLGAWFWAEYPALVRFAYLVSGDRAVAEDLVQEAFVRMHRAGARVHDAGVGAYARRAIVNLHKSFLRRVVVERRALSRYPDLRVEPDPAEGADDQVWRALDSLSARQRACIALRFYEDHKESQIAETLGISVGAVKKHTDRGMRKLRAAFDRSEQS